MFIMLSGMKSNKSTNYIERLTSTISGFEMQDTSLVSEDAQLI